MLAVNQILNRLKPLSAKELNIPDQQKVTIEDEKVLYDGHDTGWNWDKVLAWPRLSATR